MTPPPVVLLKLDQRKLPEEVFSRFTSRVDSRRRREQRAEAAWENFGKPGRDPMSLQGVLDDIAGDRRWVPHLKVAQLRTQWNLVVGDAIAAHSQVVDYRDGILTIRTQSPVWATQLTYLIPELLVTVRERLNGLDVQDIRVTGPQSSHGRYARAGQWRR